MHIHLDSFSNAGVMDLKKSLRNENGVLNALKINPKVSTWDMSENVWLVNIISSLKKKELIRDVKEDYPWHRYELTEKGLEMLIYRSESERWVGEFKP